ncbi:hypothetical protein HYS92_02850 [Candidatus Daviesbacteria bacterium]|nr:hypothetical protein [Candidatus Daviesbacteria bacterium]
MNLKKFNLQTLVIALPIASSMIIVVLIILMQPLLPFKMPLFYSLSWGEEQLATLPQFLIVPALISCISLINLMISWHLKGSQVISNDILIYSSLFTAVILASAIIKVFFLFL